MRIVTGFQNIRIGGNDTNFHDQVEDLLGQIANTAIGNELLTKINNNKSGNVLWIGKAEGGNITQVVSNDMTQLDRPFVKLRGLIRKLPKKSRDLARRKDVSDEITTTLNRAERRGRSKRTLARRLARSPLAVLATTTWRNRQIMSNAKDRRAPTDAFVDILDDLCDPDGQWYEESLKEGSGSYSFGDLLMQVLHRDLGSGLGQTAKIMFNPTIEESCVGDGQMRRRPIVVGLFHELVHAYRNVRGRRLFDDFMSCSLPDDELMTTGITPYDYVHFTENKFRGAIRFESRPGYR